MTMNSSSDELDPAVSPREEAEGAPLTRWQKTRLVIKVVELRLRFIALMAVTGLVFAYWDSLWNRYDKWMRPAAGRHAAASGIEHYCPMHPQVVQAEPGSCPICGMPLAKRKKGEKATLAPGVTARVELAPFRVRQAGIKTTEVGYAPLTQSLTTVGYVVFDERHVANIVSKVPGKTRVEKLYVNFKGQDVTAGQPLAELYSPELSLAIEELRSAVRRANTSERVKTEFARSLIGDRFDMVRASSEKLKRWGITETQIDELTKSDKNTFTFPILSPISGHVFKKNVVEGQEVQEGFAMFEVADLRSVWVLAQVYEHQLGLVREGQSVDATVEAFPGKNFPGKVEFVRPLLDPETRTVEVRFALDNVGHRLRPGMYATVTLKTPISEMIDFQTRLAVAPAEEPGVRRVSLTVAEQKVCPVTKAKLGSMGDPVSVEVEGRNVWLCCQGCEPKLKAEPAKYLADLSPRAQGKDRTPTVEEQRICPVTGAKLGSMGDPILVDVEGRKVWTCCAGCPPKLKAEPARYLARLAPAPQHEVLSVPESAVIDTGSRTVVYVESEPGVFEGREVVLGPRVGNRFPVLEGLAPGQRVAAAGAFLIDAESRINPGAGPASPGQSTPPQASEVTTRTASVPAPEVSPALGRTEGRP